MRPNQQYFGYERAKQAMNSSKPRCSNLPFHYSPTSREFWQNMKEIPTLKANHAYFFFSRARTTHLNSSRCSCEQYLAMASIRWSTWIFGQASRWVSYTLK